MRAKPTGTAPAIRANEDGNNPCGERGVSILSQTGPEVSLDNLGYSQKIPVLTCNEQTMIEHVLLFDILSPKYLLCSYCVSGLEHQKTTQKKKYGSNSDIQILLMETYQRDANKGERKEIIKEGNESGEGVESGCPT